MSVLERRSSPSAAPDLDWSQVSETVHVLNLAVAQTSMAMHEKQDMFDALSAGASVDEALQLVMSRPDEDGMDDIELF